MKNRVLEMLARICDEDIVKEELDIDLFETGLLDSLGVAEFIIACEDDFNLIISPSEIERTDMNTPNKIINLIMSRC